jgi:hypothetical protein
VVEILLSKHRDHRFGSAGEVLDIINPRNGKRRPRVPDPVRRRRTMPPSDPAGLEIAAALDRVAANPALLRVDGDGSLTPIPVEVGPPSLDAGPAIEVAHVRPQNSSSYRVRRDSSWIVPSVVAVAVAVAWSTRRLWLGEVDLPPLSVAGFAVRSSHVSLAVWILAGLVALTQWRRSRG